MTTPYHAIWPNKLNFEKCLKMTIFWVKSKYEPMSHFENKCFASTSIAYNMFALLIFPGSKVHFQEFDTKLILDIA